MKMLSVASSGSMIAIAAVLSTSALAQGATTAAPAGTPVNGAPAQTTASPVSSAPDAQVPAQAAASTANNAPGLGEIVVTANKREQNLNKVGLSISALSSQQLAVQHVATVADLARVTPGMTFAPTPNSTPVYTIRGVGFYETSLAAYPDVSTYIDQAPLPLPIMSSLTAFDLERVEVLKGPQGTLFGNNATGGAINFIAAKPTSKPTGGLEFGYGRFNTLSASGFVSGPLTDTLLARFAFNTVYSKDGWQKSFTRNDTLGQQNNYAGRLLLDWTPTSRLKFSLNLNAWVDKNDPQAPQKIVNTPQNPAPVGYPVLTYPNAPANARAADWDTDIFRPFANNRFKQASLRADYDFGGITLTSITNYIDLKYLNSTEGGGTSLLDLDIYREHSHSKSFTQEARLSNGASGRFRWVIGGNYERTTVPETSSVYYGDTTSGFANNISHNAYRSDSKMRNIAGFANAEFDVTHWITLKGGIRRTSADRDFTVSVYDDPSLPTGPLINAGTGNPFSTLTDFFNGVYSAIYGPGTVNTIPPGGGITLDTRTNPDGTPVDPSTYLTAGDYTNKLREHNTSWSAGVDIKPSSDLLIYFNASKGYKAGSFPHLVGTIYTAYNPVKQESLLDLEAGFKAQLLDHKLSVTGAVFHYDYRDKQLRAKFVDPIFGALDLLVNVPKSRVWGAEGTIQARPVDGLTLSASGTYLDAKVESYDGVVGSTVDANGLRQPVLASFKGVSLPFAPKFAYSVRADYDTRLSDSLAGFVGVGVNGQTKTSAVLTTLGLPQSYFDLNSRALVDGTIGIRAADNSWRFSIYGKNIFNKYYWINAVQTYDSVVRYTGRPAEWGASVAFRF
jgi:outer membrane receptor protein involved in Fe transport